MKEITSDYIQEQIAKGKKYILVIKKIGPKRDQPEQEAEEIQQAHLRHLFTLKERGMLLINGPVLDHPEIKGIGIYNSSDRAEILALASEDPAVKAGRLVVEAYEWFGIPGATLV
jgi:uncharacterized protein YciI